jgi:hypothetical protein
MNITNQLGRYRYILCLFAAALLFSGCDRPQASAEHVKALADKYWQAVQQGKYDEVLKFYGKSFFQLQPEAAWKARLEEIHAKLGSLKTWSLRDSQVNTMYSGRQYMFKFVNAYEKGNATETLIFFQPVDDEAITIVAHQTESLAL